MLLTFDHRASDSPLIDRVWRSQSQAAGAFLSVAASQVEMAVTRYRGRFSLTVRGPETRATVAACPAGGEWLGIRFTLGTYLPAFAPGDLADRRDVTLPDATSRSFWMDGSAWDYPDFETVETFVARLVRKGILVHDGAIDAALRGDGAEMTARSAQRHFLRATGLSRAAIRQIDRARDAAMLLQQGVSIPDTVFAAGYYDQAHLTRSTKTLMGQTPVQIQHGTQQLSFLYKTSSAPNAYDAPERVAHDRIGTNRQP